MVVAPVEVSQFPKRGEIPRSFGGAMSQDDVIKDLDLEQLTGADEIAGDSDIGFGR